MIHLYFNSFIHDFNTYVMFVCLLELGCDLFDLALKYKCISRIRYVLDLNFKNNEGRLFIILHFIHYLTTNAYISSF